MKKLIPLIILMVCGFSLGQNKSEFDNDNLIVKSTHWITDKCFDLMNQFENELCVRKEINLFIKQNLNWSIEDNLPSGDYAVRMYLTVEKDGEISKVTAKSEYSELNNELEKTILQFQHRVKLVDKNGKAHKSSLIFPLNFIVE